MSMPVHIIGASMIGPQPGFDRDRLEQVVRHTSHPLKAIEPDLSAYLDPARGRRMTKVARIGVGSGLNALKRANVERPEAIIVGTALGCVESTERMFHAVYQQAEELPSPTAFIQSTHNNVAGQLALAVKCTGYNFTYAHRGLSFSSALLDGWSQVRNDGVRNVLVGGADVMTKDYFSILSHTGMWKPPEVDALQLLSRKDTGSICGEGAAFFVLDSQPNGADSVRVSDVDIAYRGAPAGVLDHVLAFLGRNGLAPGDIDLLVLGYGGDVVQDRIYDPLLPHFPAATAAAFKPLCGEFYVANAFGLWLAYSGMTTGELPAEIILQGAPRRAFTRALLYDHYGGQDHTLVLLER